MTFSLVKTRGSISHPISRTTTLFNIYIYIYVVYGTHYAWFIVPLVDFCISNDEQRAASVKKEVSFINNFNRRRRRALSKRLTRTSRIIIERGRANTTHHHRPHTVSFEWELIYSANGVLSSSSSSTPSELMGFNRFPQHVKSRW